MTRRARPSSRSLRSGLTLLELMAASAILGVFFVFVFATVWGTLRMRDHIEQAAVPYAVGPAVMQRIVDDLQGLDVADLKDRDGFEATVESQGGGDVTRIDFVSAVPSRERVKVGDEWVRAAVNEIGYRLRRSEYAGAATSSTKRSVSSGLGMTVASHSTRRSSGDLLSLYRREDFGVDDDPKEGGKYYKLADRVKSFTIDFFDEDPGDPDGDESEGDTDWDAKDAKTESRLPWGCRVTLVLAGPPSAEDTGDGDGPQRDFVFQTYVPFRTRFDKPDGGGASGANPPGTPPAGNPPGTPPATNPPDDP